MKIVLFGATGNIGQRIVREALSRGHQVAGVVRDPARSVAPHQSMPLVRGDATDSVSVARLCDGADVVVSAISPRINARGLPAPSLTHAAHALVDGLRQTRVTRLVVVGGAGSLFVSPGMRLVDSPEFPDAHRPEALEHCEALRVYQAEAHTLDWTFFSPARVIRAGERTGTYRLGGDGLVVDQRGQSEISYEDYAMALVDEIEKPAHVKRRFTAAY